MTFPTRSSHPRTCRVCGGSGWESGPPIPAHHHGKSFDYTTLKPCSHEWRDDDPSVDEHGLDTTPGMRFGEYYSRLVARHARSAPGADVELAGWDRLLGDGIVRDA